MKEYCIYVRQGTSTPYRLERYSTFAEAQSALSLLVKYEEERQKPYYVDNDFFTNIYPLSISLKYLRLEEREVSEWNKYSYLETNTEEKSNIVFLNNYKKAIDN